jgi:hypothetical protein
MGVVSRGGVDVAREDERFGDSPVREALGFGDRFRAGIGSVPVHHEPARNLFGHEPMRAIKVVDRLLERPG